MDKLGVSLVRLENVLLHKRPRNLPHLEGRRIDGVTCGRYGEE